MPDNIDSISIELTADTSSAEESLNKLIGRLALLKVAVQGASNFTKIAGGIQRIAEAARKIETDSGEKLSNLAHGLMELSKVGDLSHLGSAAKNLSSVIKAASGSGNSANLGGLANGIRSVSDALGGITDSDVDRLGAVSDALSGETSGPIHTSSIGNESAEMGGGRASFNTGGDMAAYGAMTVFKYVADSIRDATSAYHEFTAALGGGVPPVFTEFVDEARQSSEAMRQLSGGQNAMTVFKYVADNVRDASNAYREFAGLLGGGRVFSKFADDAERTVEALRMLPEGPNWRFGDTSESSTWVADEIRDAANAASDFGNAASGSGAAIETEFTNLNSELNRTSRLFNSLKIGALNFGIVGVYLGSNLGTAIFNIAKGVAGLAAQIVRIGKYRLIRAMLKDMTQSFKDLYGWSQAYGTDFARSMDTINTAFVYLRNSIAAMVAPLVNALAPALDFVIDKVVEVLNWFNQLFAALSGASTYTVAKKVAQSWGDSFDSTSSKAKQAADNIKRTILGFDEINKLTKQNESASGSGSGSSPYSSGYTTMFEEKPLTGGFKGISDAINTEIEDRLSQITSSIGKYELAIGALLVLSKANVPLGLGLMASGAAMMGSAIIANWDGISEQIKLVIGTVEAALGAGLLAVGAILAFSNTNPGLGIGLMIAGLSMEWGAVDIVWTTLKDKVGGQVQAIATLVGAATFGIGAVLAFAAHPEIGIPMMVAGASVTAAAINWNYIKEKLQGPIGEVTALVSGASLVLGILAIVAQNYPLGLGLILAGATGLVSTVAANWDGFKEIGKTAIEKVKEGWETIKTLAVTAAVSLVKNIAEWASDVWDWLQVTGGTIAKVVEASFKAIGKWAGDAWDAVKTGAGAIGKAVEATFTAISGWTGDAWDVVKTGAGTIGKAVTATFNALGNWIGDAWNAVKAGAETIGKVVTATFSAIGGWIGDAWNTVKAGAETIGKVVTATFSAIGNWVGDAWNAVKAGAATIGKTVTATFSAIGGWVGDAWNTVKAGAQTIGKTVTATFSAISGWISPAWETVKAGAQTIAKKVEAAFAETTGWLSDAWKFINGDANVLKNIIVSFLPDLDSMPDWMAKLIGISPNQKKAADTILKTALDVVFNGKAGKGVESVNEESIELCGVSPSTVTVNGTPGNGFTGKLSGTNKYTLNGINDASVNVDMQQSWLGTPKEALGFSDLTNKAQEVKVALKKVAEWQTNGIGKYLDITTQTPKVNVDLKKKWGKKTPVDYLELSGLSTTIKVGLKSDGSKLKMRVSKGTATIESAKRRTENEETTAALGGVFSNGRWSRIPQYANGTLNAHGSLFLAGEAGPEIVGHVGGRTEVLNKSQLASAMYSAVQAAMAPAAANFASAAQSMGVADAGVDMETLAEMVRQGVEQAMGRQNELDRQRNEYLRQINEKDYNPEISTSSINKAQQRMNRRAGTTIVPVGT